MHRVPRCWQLATTLSALQVDTMVSEPQGGGFPSTSLAFGFFQSVFLDEAALLPLHRRLAALQGRWQRPAAATGDAERLLEVRAHQIDRRRGRWAMGARCVWCMSNGAPCGHSSRAQTTLIPPSQGTRLSMCRCLRHC